LSRGAAGQEQGMHGNVDMTVEDGRATAALSGDFDMAATFTVEPTLERLLDEPGLEALTLDLSAVRFVDSTGIGVLVRVTDEAQRRGIALTITPAPPEVQRVFEVSGLADVLPFS
jgi:anti-anti-sigma factor